MDKLVKAIKQHYQQEQNKEATVKVPRPEFSATLTTTSQSHTLCSSLTRCSASKVTEEKAATEGGSQGVEASRAVFVNTRRGRGNKRNITEVTAVLDAAQVRSCCGCGCITVSFPNEMNPLFFHEGGQRRGWVRWRQKEKDWRYGRRPNWNQWQAGWQER